MSPEETELVKALAPWLEAVLPGESLISARQVAGGNSNATYFLEFADRTYVLRRPPIATLDKSAHAMAREYRVLDALADTDVPAPRAVAFCADPDVIGTPFLLMDRVDGVAVTERLPSAYETSVGEVGEALVDALGLLHAVPWREVGLEGFGRPDGFLERQVERWWAQYRRYEVRDLPRFGEVASWLTENRPPAGDPAIMHGDYHADNCLLSRDAPRVNAILDWEMATIGDPLLDLGLMLAFWGGERPSEPAMPWVQSFSRVPGAPSRWELAQRYEERTGRSVTHLSYYLALAFWKLAAIVEGAYAQFVAGAVDSDYARSLREDVPRLLEEASRFALSSR